jgi:hypothetical protein
MLKLSGLYSAEILLSMLLLIYIDTNLKGATGSPGKRGKTGQKVIFQFTILTCVFFILVQGLKSNFKSIIIDLYRNSSFTFLKPTKGCFQAFFTRFTEKFKSL